MIFSLPYIIFAIFFLPFQWIPKSTSLSKQHYGLNRFIIISFLLFIGCRGFIASDWISYYPFFQKLPPLHEPSSIPFIEAWPWEKGFLVLSSFIKIFAKNYFLYQFILFGIDLFILNLIIARYVDPKNYVLTYVLFFVFQGFIIEVNLLRNAKSILLFLLSIRYINERKIYYYVLLNLLGVFFHVSSVIFFPLYFILGHRFSKVFLFSLFFVGNLLFLFRINYLVAVIALIEPVLPGRLAELVVNYGLLLGNVERASIGIGFIERTVVFVLLVTLQNKLLKKNPLLLPFINQVYLFVFVYLFLSEFWIFVQRISLLFVAGYWIVLPAMYNIFDKSKKEIFCCILFFYCLLKMGVQCDEPQYQYSNFIFSKQNYEEALINVKSQ